MIKSINEVNVSEELDMVVVEMTEENAIRMLHFANFGEGTMEAVYNEYKGNKQEMSLKMDNLEDLKEQLGVSDKKVSNLITI